MHRINLLAVFLIFHFIFISSCIAVYIGTDGSAGMVKSDAKRIMAFDLAIGSEQGTIKEPDDVLVMEIDGSQIRSLISLQSYTWVYAIWRCDGLDWKPAIHAAKAAGDSLGDGLRFVPVFMEYYPKTIQNILFEAGVLTPGYILNKDYYTAAPNYKHARLVYELCPECDPFSAQPMHFLFNQQGNLLFAARNDTFQLGSMLEVMRQQPTD